ncbi:LysR family transcriptional regulator [Limnohabitans sp. 63ED37-2]|uniref:LysR family transcriptional regulator n=1 Tax=Limnohabitans sp. 63ED37-2 TaxID=1678128 RepID=UPI000705E29B|nr:LysR family transcriptional regulator [Limnohabitans sp. 63ED37-2]ALK87930.1 HTH-type transcriptional regulator CynR [Limnohabitans sp. 63ED37-2]
MNLRHLEHWLALAETGSFSRAAEKLHITQSALSRSIQALEEDLGGPLVDRVGKKNELTPLGRSVLERARRIVHEARELKQGATLLQRGGLGTLRVGLGSGPGAMLMTPWLVYMANHHPTVQVTVSRGSTELQLTQLRDRQLDALVVDLRRVEAAPDLKIEHVVDMRAGFVCRREHPVLQAHPRGVPLDALLSYPIASIQLSQEVARLLVDHYGPQANPAQMTTLQCEDIASLLDVVGQTDAVYLGIVGAAREGLAQGRLVELQMRTPLKGQARLGLITLAGRTELPIMSVFRAFIQKHLTD